MLPAVKVFAVAALLGGGAVGTFALAGGFGSGGSGTGNREATAQVAATTETAKPAVTEQGVQVTPETKAPQAAEAERSSGVIVDGVLQQEESVEAQRSADLGSDGQAQQQTSDANRNPGTVIQDTTPSEPQPESQGNKSSEGVQSGDQGQSTNSQSLSVGVASRDQGGTAKGQSSPEGKQGVVPSKGSPEASTTIQQGAPEANAGDNGKSSRASDPLTATDSGNTGEDGSKGPGSGTDGEEASET